MEVISMDENIYIYFEGSLSVDREDLILSKYDPESRSYTYLNSMELPVAEILELVNSGMLRINLNLMNLNNPDLLSNALDLEVKEVE
jgi:hypothetical protein